MSGPRFPVTPAIRVLLLAAVSAATAQAAQETAPSWAFPLTSPSTSPAPPQEEHYTLPGSTRKFSRTQLRDRTTAVDWFPSDHPRMPPVVKGGSGPLAACGFCHLPEGQGRPENASLAALPYAYLMQQLSDMKSGARKLADPHFVPGGLMLQAAAQISGADADQAARYFAGLRYVKRFKVMEAASIPSSRAEGFVYVFDTAGAPQPLDNRIVEGPDDFSRFEARDSRTTYTAYVPIGSVARGAELAKGDGQARQACVTCHGPDLRGGPIGPPIAGRSPTGIFRQLYGFQLGTRNGPNAMLMKPIVASLSHGDMIALAAYAGSLTPAAAAPSVATADLPWHDRSPHSRKFVQVERGVSLEVLDWGGTGRPIVLLTGLGNTAHIYDDFAPKLARGFHVLGITRRGFGESSAGSSGYSADRLADDVLAVVGHLQLRRPVLVGHSIAGEELSSVASRHPERIAGLVYLDAVWPYSFDDGTTGVNRGDLEALQRKLPAIGPAAADLASPKALQRWLLRTSGVLEPEADFHHWAPSAQSVMQSVLAGEQRYSELRAPILALCAMPQYLGPPVEGSHDPAVVAAREQWQVLKEKTLAAFERGVPNARVVRMPANHYLFISNQRQVLLQIRQFLSTLPP